MASGGEPLQRSALALVVLCVLCLSVGVFAESVQHGDDDSSRISTMFAEVDSQVEHALKHTTHTTQQAADEPTKIDPALNVGLKNMLDLKTLTLDIVPGVPKRQPRHVLVAFLQIAWEAVQRGKFALAQLTNLYKTGKQNLKVNDHNLKAWISNHFSLAQSRIRREEERVGRLTDEINHLQHVYQDAVAKEKSYQEQASHLVSEHQLQSTPPLIPAVAAAALPEGQYQQVIGRLDQYRRAALSIMQETALAITTRQHMVDQTSDWVKNAKKALEQWHAKQQQIATKRTEDSKKQLEQLRVRAKNVKIITQDAENFFKDYMNALHRIDVEHRIAVLKQEEKNYTNVPVNTAYDKVKLDSFVGTVKLEIEALEAQLGKMNGSSEVIAPPAAWGVLAGFHPPAIHQNAFPSPVYTVKRPDGTASNYLYSPPGGMYYRDPSTPSVVPPVAPAQAQAQTQEPSDPSLPSNSAISPLSVPITIPGSILAPLPSLDAADTSKVDVAQAVTPAAAQAAAQAAKSAETKTEEPPKFREIQAPAPPAMPDLPAPPTDAV